MNLKAALHKLSLKRRYPMGRVQLHKITELKVKAETNIELYKLLRSHMDVIMSAAIGMEPAGKFKRDISVTFVLHDAFITELGDAQLTNPHPDIISYPLDFHIAFETAELTDLTIGE